MTQGQDQGHTLPQKTFCIGILNNFLRNLRLTVNNLPHMVKPPISRVIWKLARVREKSIGPYVSVKIFYYSRYMQ